MERPWLSHWPKNVPQSIDYPELSLGEVLRRAAARAPKKVALIYYGTKLTYKELDALVDRFGEALQDFGVEKGDRVAIYLPNFPQFVIAYFGALRIGATVVTSSPLYKERELGHILVDSGAKVLVAWDRLYPYVQAVRNKSKVSRVITTSARDYMPPVLRLLSPLRDDKSYACLGADDMKTLLDKYSGRPKPVEIAPKEDLALLQYTGGTTGVPKGAMLTHYNLVVNATQVSAWLGMQSADVHMAALPLFHIYGMTMTMTAPVLTWSTIVLILDPRNVRNILQAIDKYKPTLFSGTPTTYGALINQPDIHRHDLRSIRACISGASALPAELQRRFEELTGGRLVEGYGLTETSPVTHVNPLDDPKKNRIGSIGIPVSDTDSKIVDLETGEIDLPPDTVGELVIRGPQVMNGYWNNPAESKLALRNGWFYTGDIAIMDPDGYFRIVDRKKDMINVSGLKVWPREVEEVLYEHPAVKEAGVVGIPDKRSGEAVKAYVVLKEEYVGRVNPEDLTKFCKEKIAVYKAPSIIEFRQELPKTAVGKILRRELKQPA